MNRRIIQKILTGKHNDFIKSIKDEKVRELVNKNSIITGGSIVSLLLKERVKDYDYYFTNQETVEAVAGYYCEEYKDLNPDKECPVVSVKEGRVKIVIKSAGVAGDMPPEEYEHPEEEPEDANKYHPVFISANAITLSHKVQLVLRFYGEAEDIHKNYDFVHCTNYWTSKDRKLTLVPRALESILTKQLHYQGSLYPLCSVIRTRKFLKQGWHINAGQYLKMCFQISELDLNNIEVLEEQLTGVDALYFFQVIRYCRERQEADKDFKITPPYLAEVIDRIFGGAE